MGTARTLRTVPGPGAPLLLPGGMNGRGMRHRVHAKAPQEDQTNHSDPSPLGQARALLTCRPHVENNQSLRGRCPPGNLPCLAPPVSTLQTLNCTTPGCSSARAALQGNAGLERVTSWAHCLPPLFKAR